MQAAQQTVPVYAIDNLPGGPAPEADVMVERFGSYLAVHPNLHAAHGHTFYHLVLFTRGGGSHTIDFRQFPVQAGAAYFMVPGQVHSWAFEGETDGYVVNFSETFFQSLLADPAYLEQFRFFSGDSADGVIMLPDTMRPEAVRLLEMAVQELEAAAPLHLDAVRLLLLQFFILIARSGSLAPEPVSGLQGRALTLRNFRKLLNRHFRELRLPKDYAALLYVTPNYLNALCQDLLQMPAGEIIRERILLEAKRLLINQRQDIAGIAYELGFKDNSYFSRFFRKYAGQSPEAFRREHRQAT